MDRHVPRFLQRVRSFIISNFFFSFWLKFSSRLFPKINASIRAEPVRTGFFSESGPVLGEATRVTWRPFNPFVPRMRKSRWNCSFRRAILSQDGQRLDEEYPTQGSSQCHGQRRRQGQGQGIALNNRYRFQTCFPVEWLPKMASLLIRCPLTSSICTERAANDDHAN